LVDDDQGEGIKDFFENLAEIDANISNKVLSKLVLDQAGLESSSTAHYRAEKKAGTFATKRFGPISPAKRLRILTELLRLWETGIFQVQGKRYKIDRAGIVAGMRTVCDLEKYGLPNHNYLKKVLLNRAERVSAEGLTAKEEQKKIEDQKTRRSEHQNNNDAYSPDALAAFKKKMGVSKVKDLIRKRPEVGEDV